MLKTIVRSPITTIVLFLAAAALLVVGGVGAAQAAPQLTGGDYTAKVKLDSLEISIVENGTDLKSESAANDTALLGKRFLDANGIDESNPFEIGKIYDESLAVSNSGAIDEYVRVTVLKYWTDKDGNKMTNPEYAKYIELTWGDKWSIDENVSTAERTVLYYPEKVAPGEPTDAFVTNIKISEEVKNAKNGNFHGATFHVDVTANAVQTHNGTEAMTGVWGRTV